MIEPGLHHLAETREFAEQADKYFAYARWIDDRDTAGFIRVVEDLLQES
ncbi:hypothetical protein [Kitasatospora brasiliensis]|nr:hypothetical protein [Kitasatospora sp. K002]